MSERAKKNTPPPGIEPAKVRSILLAASEKLSKRDRETILALGQAAIPPLMEVLEVKAFANEDAPGDGYAPCHAADLLGELRAVEAIDLLLDWLAEADSETVMRGHACGALIDSGPPVLEPALRAYRETSDRDLHIDLSAILAELEVRDDRIFDLLVEELEADPFIGVGLLGQYGDERALPRLLHLADTWQPPPEDGPPGDDIYIELKDAIESLGGPWKPEHEESSSSTVASLCSSASASPPRCSTGPPTPASAAGARALPTRSLPLALDLQPFKRGAD